MIRKCKCGRKIIKFPWYEGQEDGEKYSEGKKIYWLNLFKMDIMSVIWLAVVIFLMMGYKLDMKQCEDAIEHPCDFCEKTNCCNNDLGKIDSKHLGNVKIEGIEDSKFNTTEG